LVVRQKCTEIFTTLLQSLFFVSMTETKNSRN